MASIDDLLRQLGPMSNENANRARGFYGANPDQLERKLMGLKGGSGQQGAGDMDQILENVIQQTAPATPRVAPEVSSGQTYDAPQRPAATRQALTPAEQAGPQARGAPSYGPGAAPDAGGGFDLGNWLLAILGARPALDTYDNTMKPRIESTSQRYLESNPAMQRLTTSPANPQITDQGAGNRYRSGAPKLDSGEGVPNPDRFKNDQQVRLDVAKENAANATADEAMMEQLMRRNAAQNVTRQTIGEAKRAVGRR